MIISRKILKLNGIVFACVFMILVQISCKSISGSEAGHSGRELPAVESAPEKALDQDDEIIAEFGSITITKKDYKETKSEIEIVVDNLNKVTAAKDYIKWLSYLSEDYKSEYSKPAVLQITSDSLPVKGIKLKNLQDYFSYVFVPSRQNIKVDDIKFVSPVKVNVITKAGNKKLLVYNLEKIKGKWLLIPKE